MTLELDSEGLSLQLDEITLEYTDLLTQKSFERRLFDKCFLERKSIINSGALIQYIRNYQKRGAIEISLYLLNSTRIYLDEGFHF